MKLGSTLLLLSGSVAAFNVGPNEKAKVPSTATNKNFANVLMAGVISAAVILPLAPGPAVAKANPLVVGTPLEAKLATFGKTSYPVFNSITDVSPLFDKLLGFIDEKINPPDSAAVAQKAVDGLLAIPDSAIADYRGVLQKTVYKGVNGVSCVTLGGSGAALDKVANSAAVKSVDSSKMSALQKKFSVANKAVVKKGNDICLPGSAAASEKLWVAQAELTFSMPKTEAKALVGAIKTAGAQIPRSAIAPLQPSAYGVFSKNADAVKMAAAGKDVEPIVISTVTKALK